MEKPGVRKLADIKLMKEDPEGVEKGAEEIKTALRADFQGVTVFANDNAWPALSTSHRTSC